MIRSRQPPLTKTFIGSNSCLNNLASVDASIRGESLSHSGFPHFIAAQTKPDTHAISTSQGVNHASSVETPEKVWQSTKREFNFAKLVATSFLFILIGGRITSDQQHFSLRR